MLLAQTPLHLNYKAQPDTYTHSNGAVISKNNLRNERRTKRHTKNNNNINFGSQNATNTSTRQQAPSHSPVARYTGHSRCCLIGSSRPVNRIYLAKRNIKPKKSTRLSLVAFSYTIYFANFFFFFILCVLLFSCDAVS